MPLIWNSIACAAFAKPMAAATPITPPMSTITPTWRRTSACTCREGHIEQIPLPSNSVDVIISNCVINLSGDKRTVLAEAFRVLKPGGRFAVSDVITRGEVPEPVRATMPMWTGCVAGALDEQEFKSMLSDVGFEKPSIEPTRVYTHADAAALLEGTGLDPALASGVEGKIMSGFVRATKPSKKKVQLGTRSCGCDDNCCA